jgi:hypothetical protein
VPASAVLQRMRVAAGKWLTVLSLLWLLECSCVHARDIGAACCAPYVTCLCAYQQRHIMWLDACGESCSVRWDCSNSDTDTNSVYITWVVLALSVMGWAGLL